MALTYENGIVTMEPGPMDMHGHPRALDPITDHDLSGNGDYEGKAGLPSYTETALLSGLVVVSAMPNEFFRVVDEMSQDGTKLIQFPISNADRAFIMETSIRTQSRINMTYHFGLDPTDIIYGANEELNVRKLAKNFETGARNATALKVFGNISTGGNNVPLKHIPQIVQEWYEQYPSKPVIMHLEDDNVGAVLEQIYLDCGGKIPIHIAHISSKQELEAVILAKELGMNVSCEVTPHHLFATADDAELIGGFGCMKPSLKSPEDVKFLWDNMGYIDIIASDCAPHKLSDKLAMPPTFGVTNHTTMMPLLFGAVQEGRLSLEDLYAKLVINPRVRLGLPLEDKTQAIFDVRSGYDNAEEVERLLYPKYGENIFPRLERLGKSFRLLGHLVAVESGQSSAHMDDQGILIPRFKTSLKHLYTAA